MNRWVVRLIGVLMLLIFILLLVNLQRQLAVLHRTRKPAAATPR